MFFKVLFSNFMFYLNVILMVRKEFFGDRYCVMECNKVLFKVLFINFCY